MTSLTPPARPAYDGVVPYPPHALAYEGSPMVKVTGDRFQYVEELSTGRTKIKEALDRLRQVVDEPMLPRTGSGETASWRLISAVDDARRAVSPYMNHVPGSPGFENNEVPRFLADGAVHPDDLGNRRMNLAGSVQMHQETVIHRLPKKDLEGVNWQSVADSLETSTRIDDLLIWGNKATTDGMPDVSRAVRELEQLDRQFAAVLQNQGGPNVPVRTPGSGGIVQRLSALPTGVKVAAGAGLALAVVGGGVALARD